MKQRKRKKLLVTLLLCALALACSAMFSVSMAKYRVQQRLAEQAQLGQPQLSIIDQTTGKEVDWEVSIPATTRLYESEYAANDGKDKGEFDRAVVVRRLRIKNVGDQTVDLTTALKSIVTQHDTEDTAKSTTKDAGLCIYVFAKDQSANYGQAVRVALQVAGYSLSDESDPATLIQALEAQTKANLAAKKTLEPGALADYTVLIWRENDIDHTTRGNGSIDFSQKVDLYQHLKLLMEQSA